MGSNDIPPPHVPASYHRNYIALLGVGGVGYTMAYILMTRQSLRDRTYAMPLFQLAINLGWEIIFGLYVAESLLEKTAFLTWLVLDMGLVYTTVIYGKNEWTHAPVVGRHIGKILGLFTLWWCWAYWAFSKWWIKENINPKLGKIYMGVEGIDTTELGFWASMLAQNGLSCSLLAQLIVRGHSGGTSYTIWACRFIGSLFGLNGAYAYFWYVWPEAHGYFMNPIAVCTWMTWMVVDVVYLYILKETRRTEVVLKDGRKIRGGAVASVKVS
jgi:hypothetical protein